MFSLMSAPGCALPSIEIQATDRLTGHGRNSLTGGGLKLAGIAGVDGNKIPLSPDQRFSMKNVLRGGKADGLWKLLSSKVQALPYINKSHPHSSTAHV
jgi:hypothetical protein